MILCESGDAVRPSELGVGALVGGDGGNLALIERKPSTGLSESGREDGLEHLCYNGGSYEVTVAIWKAGTKNIFNFADLRLIEAVPTFERE